MFRNRLFVLVVAAVAARFTVCAQFADRVVGYSAGSGISGAYTEPGRVLGAPARFNGYQDTDPFNPPYRSSELVGIGAGGALTVYCSSPIKNDPANPFGTDFIVFGHAGFSVTNFDVGTTDGSLFTGGTAATGVSVSADGVTFYALNPAVAPVVDGLLPTDAAGNPLVPADPALEGADFAGKDLAGIRALYQGSAGGAGFDLAWAQDTAGESVSLASVNYVRIEVLSGSAYIDALAAVRGASTRVVREDFAANPLSQGWRVFGNADLFRWNPTNQNLEVTWDSSQPNSFLQLPLGTILGRADEFSFSLELRLDDVTAGVNPAKPSTFELGFGLQNSAEAEGTNFFRGNAKSSPNLVEFDYFPDTGFGPTLWPAMWSSNSTLNYNGSTDYTLMGLPLGAVMRITLVYSADAQTLTTTITTNGVSVGAINPVPLSAGFTDFRVGTFAIPSYSDAGQPAQGPGSLLAHGVIDNVVVTVPPPPIRDLQIESGGQVRFLSRVGWLYTLERTIDFANWSPVSAGAPGTGAMVTLQDPSAPMAAAYYRVRAERP